MKKKLTTNNNSDLITEMKTFKITLDDSEIEVLTQLEDTAMLPPADIESAILAGIVNQIRRQDDEDESQLK